MANNNVIPMNMPQVRRPDFGLENNFTKYYADGNVFLTQLLNSLHVVFPEGDPATHTFRVRLDLPEIETGLMPGMTVKAAFDIGDAERILVPASALVRRSEVTAVYVVDDRHVVLRQVRLGHRQGERVEVLAGLEPGERIAADPLAALAWLGGSDDTRAR